VTSEPSTAGQARRLDTSHFYSRLVKE